MVIIDVIEYRLDLARNMGATAAVNVAEESLNEVMKGLGMVEGY